MGAAEGGAGRHNVKAGRQVVPVCGVAAEGMVVLNPRTGKRQAVNARAAM